MAKRTGNIRLIVEKTDALNQHRTGALRLMVEEKDTNNYHRTGALRLMVEYYKNPINLTVDSASHDLLSTQAALEYYSDQTDDFTYADGDLHDANNDWVYGSGSLVVESGAVKPGGSGLGSSWKDQIEYEADQFSEMNVYGAGSGSWVGPAVRIQSKRANTWYAVRVESNQAFLHKMVDGVETDLATAATVAPGDLIRIEVSGSDLTMKVNGATTKTASDATLAGGKPGIVSHGPKNGNKGDGWHGGHKKTGVTLRTYDVYHAQGTSAPTLNLEHNLTVDSGVQVFASDEVYVAVVSLYSGTSFVTLFARW